MARNVGGVFAGQELHGSGHIVGRAGARQRHRGQDLPLRLVGQSFGHVGFDIAGGHRVHRDAAAGHLLRQGLREPDQAGLRRGIVGLTRGAGLSHHRCNIDDSAPASAHHAGKHRLNAAKRACQIDVHHQVPIGLLMRTANPSRVTPALLTSTSMRPLSLSAFPKASLTESGDVTSRSTVMAWPLHARISSATSWLLSIAGEAITMSKPARQSDRAVARPIPRLAPVTKATRLSIRLHSIITYGLSRSA